MRATRLINTIKSWFGFKADDREPPFQNLPQPWTIDQVEDEEDPKVP